MCKRDWTCKTVKLVVVAGCFLLVFIMISWYHGIMVWWILQNHHLHLISCRLEVPLPSFSAKLPTHLVLPFNDHHINDDDHHIDNHHHYYHCIPPLPPYQAFSPPPVAAPSRDNADVGKEYLYGSNLFQFINVWKLTFGWSFVFNWETRNIISC